MTTSYKWLSNGIASKWPAVRIIGPDVSVENARDFILRTDRALVSFWSTGNNRDFQRAYSHFLGFQSAGDFHNIGDDGYDWTPYNNAQNLWNRFETALGHISVGGFASNWVHSCYVGGPDGLVSPTGKVELAKNFGKWPSEEDIERDLERLAAAFPWLSFKMALWDYPEEAEAVEELGKPATMAWELANGTFKRVDANILDGEELPKSYSMDAVIKRINSGRESETTFSMLEIEKIWGKQLLEAAGKAKDSSIILEWEDSYA